MAANIFGKQSTKQKTVAAVATVPTLLFAVAAALLCAAPLFGVFSHVAHLVAGMATYFAVVTARPLLEVEKEERRAGKVKEAPSVGSPKNRSKTTPKAQQQAISQPPAQKKACTPAPALPPAAATRTPESSHKLEERSPKATKLAAKKADRRARKAAERCALEEPVEAALKASPEAAAELANIEPPEAAEQPEEPSEQPRYKAAMDGFVSLVKPRCKEEKKNRAPEHTSPAGPRRREEQKGRAPRVTPMGVRTMRYSHAHTTTKARGPITAVEAKEPVAEAGVAEEPAKAEEGPARATEAAEEPAEAAQGSVGKLAEEPPEEPVEAAQVAEKPAEAAEKPTEAMETAEGPVEAHEQPEDPVEHQEPVEHQAAESKQVPPPPHPISVRSPTERDVMRLERKAREVAQLRQRQLAGEALDWDQLEKLDKTEQIHRSLADCRLKYAISLGNRPAAPEQEPQPLDEVSQADSDGLEDYQTDICPTPPDLGYLESPHTWDQHGIAPWQVPVVGALPDFPVLTVPMIVMPEQLPMPMGPQGLIPVVSMGADDAGFPGLVPGTEEGQLGEQGPMQQLVVVCPEEQEEMAQQLKILDGMADMEETCWSWAKLGWCPRGDRCAWWHPPLYKTL